MKWIVRIGGVLFGLILTALLSALAYERIMTVRDRGAYPPPGELVDVGGYRLHMHVTGEATDLPTVILEHGGMGMSAQWGWIQPELARHTRVVAYDRPGMGWSDPGPADQDARRLIEDVRFGLEQLGIDGPYVLVGHSLGGLTARLFAGSYPDEVAGVVLIDPRDVTQEGIYTAEELAAFEQVIGMYGLAGRLGIVRMNGAAAAATQDLPPQQAAAGAALTASYRHLGNARAEWDLGNSAAELVRRIDVAPTTPLRVLSAGAADDSFNVQQRTAMTAQHAQLAERSPHWTHQVVDGAEHVSIVTRQEFAQAVSAATLEMLTAGR
jgi:pimeloyl-ACP methyl ester carboxylesterase